jgi:hypothetical protein
MTLELDLSAARTIEPIIVEQNRKREYRMKEMKANKETDFKLSSE